MQAHELEPVRLEVVAAGAAVAQRLALCNKPADRLLEPLDAGRRRAPWREWMGVVGNAPPSGVCRRMVERVHGVGFAVQFDVVAGARVVDEDALALRGHGRKMRYAVPRGHPEQMRRSSR